jgi:hypothetical protein
MRRLLRRNLIYTVIGELDAFLMSDATPDDCMDCLRTIEHHPLNKSSPQRHITVAQPRIVFEPYASGAQQVGIEESWTGLFRLVIPDRVDPAFRAMARRSGPDPDLSERSGPPHNSSFDTEVDLDSTDDEVSKCPRIREASFYRHGD